MTTGMNVELIRTRKVAEAHGAICRDCSATFEVATNQYWGWRKSQAMHESGTGHRMDMFRIGVR